VIKGDIVMYKVLIPEGYKTWGGYDSYYHAVRFDTEEQAYGFALAALHYTQVVHEEMYFTFTDIYMLDVNTDKLFRATNYERKEFKGQRSVLSFVWEEADEDDEYLRSWF
jgi:hypothetical protein